jgi:hypothetical protein
MSKSKSSTLVEGEKITAMPNQSVCSTGSEPPSDAILAMTLILLGQPFIVKGSIDTPKGALGHAVQPS